jgi:hypothetical protein
MVYLRKIISGGQSGADRAALDAALLTGFPCGGFCPRNRKAEDGPIDPKYPMTEINGNYADRREANVMYSDGTVIFYSIETRSGTKLTMDLCLNYSKPHLEIEINQSTPDTALAMIREFVNHSKINTLNVAGPRKSQCPEIYDFVSTTIGSLLKESTQGD